ncbi:MAG: T9SS type A sorting domain-containing protein [Spirochaetales bacterium]|nr:T9SS type A sorting domain-containing protein [Spirochaetales bacterium]
MEQTNPNFMKRIYILILLVIPIYSLGQSIDRQVVSTAGGTFESSSISISWTLGELAIGTFSVGDIMLTQGFHQGSLEVNSIEDIELNFKLKAYPNPVTDFLVIETDRLGVFFQIVDSNGKVLLNGNIENETQEIDFTNFTSGFYFLWIEGNQTHKIIKN